MDINNFGRTSFVTWTEAELRQERQEMTEQELLSVLDPELMDEDEQDTWCRNYAYSYYFRGSLADLAFKLRDEVKEELWVEGTMKVFAYKHPENSPNSYSVAAYFADSAKPIHWVIAALIAKGKEK